MLLSTLFNFKSIQTHTHNFLARNKIFSMIMNYNARNRYLYNEKKYTSNKYHVLYKNTISVSSAKMQKKNKNFLKCYHLTYNTHIRYDTLRILL